MCGFSGKKASLRLLRESLLEMEEEDDFEVSLLWLKNPEEE